MTETRSSSSLFQAQTPEPSSSSANHNGDQPRKSRGDIGVSNIVPGTRHLWIKSKIFKLKNQTLSAWRPVMNQKTGTLLFFVVGVVFVPIGAVFVALHKDTKDVTVHYTDCFTASGSNCKDFVLDINNQING